MTQVLDGTLDAHSRSELTRMTPAEQANFQYDDELAGYTTPREWWRVATLPDGTAVGFVIPARNAYNAIIAYIGVLPAFRGKGYIDDVLGEGTRILAAQGVPRTSGRRPTSKTCQWHAPSLVPGTPRSSGRST